MDIKEAAKKYNDYIIQRRRFYHSIPELSFQEFETTEAIARDMADIGIDVETFKDYNGLIGTIKGELPGKTVMLRADIDALPVEEHTGLPFASQNGNMHACGHDAHIAMLLGAAKIIYDYRSEIKGTIKFLFQAAEESCYGAKYYADNNLLEGVDAVFGMHIWGTLEVPFFNLESGSRMASVDNFKITVEGVSSHGSAPNLGKDAILAASAIITNIQSLVSRMNDPLNPLVVSVGTLHAGQRFNIIANHAEMEGTVRSHSREIRMTVEQNLKQIAEQTASALGCSAKLEYNYYAAPVINEYEPLNKIVRNSAVKLYGEESLAYMPRLMGSEDFSYLTENVPGFYGFIGTKNREKCLIYTNHNDRFTVDEDVLHRGAALYAQFAFDFLEESSAEGWKL